MDLATLRTAQAAIAVAARLHGPDSPDTKVARRRYAAIKAAYNLHVARSTHGDFAPEDRRLILEALTGATPE